MSNEDVYATGLLNRALDPSTQPPEIRAFLQAEIDLLASVVSDGMAVLDIGCGTGRHLLMLRDRLRVGLGVDYDHASIVAAQRAASGPVHFVTADATQLPIRSHFDLAMCMTNTWGTMDDKRRVLDEMRRCVSVPGMRLVSVFGEASVAPRREWYQRFGHRVVEESDEHLLTDGGLRSEHFSEARLRALIGDCTVHPYAGIGYVARF